jgi:PAS domain S-box-containing protein
MNREDAASSGGVLKQLERFQRLVEESPALIWAFDEVNGRMIYVNPTVEEALGYDGAEFYARPMLWFDLIHPEDRPLAAALNHTMREEKKAITYILRFQKKDGSYVKLTTVVKPILDNRRKIVRTEGAAIAATDKGYE